MAAVSQRPVSKAGSRQPYADDVSDDAVLRTLSAAPPDQWGLWLSALGASVHPVDLKQGEVARPSTCTISSLLGMMDSSREDVAAPHCNTAHADVVSPSSVATIEAQRGGGAARARRNKRSMAAVTSKPAEEDKRDLDELLRGLGEPCSQTAAKAKAMQKKKTKVSKASKEARLPMPSPPKPAEATAVVDHGDAHSHMIGEEVASEPVQKALHEMLPAEEANTSVEDKSASDDFVAAAPEEAPWCQQRRRHRRRGNASGGGSDDELPAAEEIAEARHEVTHEEQAATVVSAEEGETAEAWSRVPHEEDEGKDATSSQSEEVLMSADVSADEATATAVDLEELEVTCVEPVHFETEKAQLLHSLSEGSLPKACQNEVQSSQEITVPYRSPSFFCKRPALATWTHAQASWTHTGCAGPSSSSSMSDPARVADDRIGRVEPPVPPLAFDQPPPGCWSARPSVGTWLARPSRQLDGDVQNSYDAHTSSGARKRSCSRKAYYWPATPTSTPPSSPRCSQDGTSSGGVVWVPVPVHLLQTVQRIIGDASFGPSAAHAVRGH